MSAKCEGVLEFGDELFHCWRKDGHGNVDLVDAIRESCDVYFYELAQKLGINSIAKMAVRMGFGEVPDIEIPGERPGLILQRNGNAYPRRRLAGW